MKWSFAAGGMFLLGVMGVAAIILFQKLTTSNENDYYLLKEITEAAMYDSIDLSYYKNTGNVKIVKEKFVENFTRRYAESTLFIGTKYIISFYDIIEEPPKVSILINGGVENYRIYGPETEADYNVKNSLTGIFEYVGPKTNESSPYYNPELNYDEMGNYLYETNPFEKIYYSNVEVNADKTVGTTQPINIPEELLPLKIKDKSLKIKSVSASPINVNVVNETQRIEALGEILRAKLKRELDWKKAQAHDPATEYYKYIDTSKIASTITNFSYYYYNCDDPTAPGTQHDADMVCADYDGFWIHWDGKTTENDKSEMFLKLNITWEYDEYEYEH